MACDQWRIMTCVCFSCNRGISWVTKDGVQHANYFGSLTQASTCRIGSFSGEEIYVPFKSLLPMVFSNLQCTACFNIRDKSVTKERALQQEMVFWYQLLLLLLFVHVLPCCVFLLPGPSSPLFFACRFLCTHMSYFGGGEDT